MMLENINMNFAAYTIVGAVPMGFLIGIILWAIRWLLIELPRPMNIFRKGGDLI